MNLIPKAFWECKPVGNPPEFISRIEISLDSDGSLTYYNMEKLKEEAHK